MGSWYSNLGSGVVDVGVGVVGGGVGRYFKVKSVLVELVVGDNSILVFVVIKKRKLSLIGEFKDFFVW